MNTFPPEPTNADRAAWVQAALEAFARETGQTEDLQTGYPEDTAEVLMDMLADVYHFCDINEFDLGELTRKARTHYLAELELHRDGCANTGPVSECARCSQPSRDEKIATPAEREPIKCPKCKTGELQCVRDASITRSVVGAIMKGIPSAIKGNPPYRYAEAELSDEHDVHAYYDYRLCCNECDETFDDDEIYDLVYPAEVQA